jgi:hypothetical protein
MRVSQFGRVCGFLGAVVLLLAVFSTASSTHNATGRFEMYCDGVGFFLANIDGAPPPRELFFFLYVSFPPGTMGGRYLPQEQWSNVSVYPKGCMADAKCEVIAHGKVWIDKDTTPPPRRLSGKYEIDLNDQHLKGLFVVKEHQHKYPPRVCM